MLSVNKYRYCGKGILANTPELTSTGTTQSNNLPIGSFSANDTIIFTNDSVAPAFDPAFNYDPTTGQFEVVSTGVYSLNAVIDINATFTPSGGSVKTICDIHGFIKVFYTPISTGVPVQTDAVPFYITKDDNSFMRAQGRQVQHQLIQMMITWLVRLGVNFHKQHQ